MQPAHVTSEAQRLRRSISKAASETKSCCGIDACRRQLSTDQRAAVSSSDQRNDGGLKDLVWSLPLQGSAWPVVDLGDDGEQVLGAV
jgi:hypothetical protein